MTIVLVWVFFSFLIALAGRNRKFGGTNAFFLSLLLSPIIGLIGVALSGPKEPSSVLSKSGEINNRDRLGELERLAVLRDTGALTDAEFEVEKSKVLGVSKPVEKVSGSDPRFQIMK